MGSDIGRLGRCSTLMQVANKKRRPGLDGVLIGRAEVG
jgi:hypothetical protein